MLRIHKHIYHGTCYFISDLINYIISQGKKALVLTLIDNMSSSGVIDSRTVKILSPSTAISLVIDSRILNILIVHKICQRS